MTDSLEPLSAGGWTLVLGTAVYRGNPGTPRDFHGVLLGEKYDATRRGTVVAVARGNGHAAGASEAAQLTIQGFTESYFGARATLSNARAAGRALSTINSWLFNQGRTEPQRQETSASFTALLLFGKQAAIVHVGDNRSYRLRGGQLVPLTFEHLRQVGGVAIAAGAVGADRDLRIDYNEDEAQTGDRYILLTSGITGSIPEDRLLRLLKQDIPPNALAESLTAASQDGHPVPADATAIVVDIGALPEASFTDVASAFSRLPLLPPPRDGDNVDGFAILKTLYRSRYTLLKLARDTTEDREVVIKFPLPAMLQDQVFQAGFLREAWIGASVRSQWVAQYLTVAPGRQSRLYLVLPYYRGETLESRLLRSPKVSFADGMGIAFKLCAAVRDLESLQVIHRDLKPENIIILADGDVRLLDLGLAYLAGLDDPDDSRLGGTTRYMAPELFGKAPAGPRSEVFSLGITIYRMFSGGEFPFGRRESYPLARLRPELPPWLGLCLKRAIDLDPDQRFANAEAFAKALEEGLQHGSKDGPGDRSWTAWANSRQAWQVLTGVLAAALLFILSRQLLR